MTYGLLGEGYIRGMLKLWFNCQDNGWYRILGGGGRDKWATEVRFCGQPRCSQLKVGYADGWKIQFCGWHFLRILAKEDLLTALLRRSMGPQIPWSILDNFRQSLRLRESKPLTLACCFYAKTTNHKPWKCGEACFVLQWPASVVSQMFQVYPKLQLLKFSGNLFQLTGSLTDFFVLSNSL